MKIQTTNRQFVSSAMFTSLTLATLLLSCNSAIGQTTIPELPPFCSDTPIDNDTKAKCQSLKIRILEATENQVQAAANQVQAAANKVDNPKYVESNSLPTGKMELSDKKYEGTIEAALLAYQSMSDVARSVNYKIAPFLPKNAHLIILDNETMAGLVDYDLFIISGVNLIGRYQSELCLSEDELREMMKKLATHMNTARKGGIDFGTSFGLAYSSIRAFSDIYSLFRLDTKIAPIELKLEYQKDSIIAAMASDLKASNYQIKLVYPEQYLFEIGHLYKDYDGEKISNKNKIANKDNDGKAIDATDLFPNDYMRLMYDIVFLAQLQNKAKYKITQIENDPKGAVCSMEPTKDEKPEQRKTNLKELNNSVDEIFKATALSATSKDGKSTLSSRFLALVKAAMIRNILREEKGYILNLNLLIAGGSVQTRNGLFFSSTDYNGGLAVNYILYDKDGSILVGDNIYKTSGFVPVTQDTTNTIKFAKP